MSLFWRDDEAGGETVKLYHYTGAEHIEGIQRQGIHLGFVPLAEGPRGGWMGTHGTWLTTSADWQQQVWATSQEHNCDRTEYRFTVAIPKAHRERLHLWTEWSVAAGCSAYFLEHFNWEGHEHWHLFLDSIPSGWLRGLEQRPSGVAAPPRERLVLA